MEEADTKPTGMREEEKEGCERKEIEMPDVPPALAQAAGGETT